MDGAHDLGGKTGFGHVTISAREPAFHECWEATAWVLNVLAIGTLRTYKADAYRHAVERMEPSWCLRASYYERTLTAVATLLVERGLASLDDLEQRAGGRIPLSEPVATLPVLQTEDTVATQARFGPGDPVLVIAQPTPGHTRCPAYVRGHRGVVRRVYPLAYYPELRAHSTVKRREHGYAIEFQANELWVGGDPQQSVLVDLFESYLDFP
jgi:nitrile hydratase